MSPAYPIRRRPRECKTCLPCRAGKVRCDRNVPCGNCVRRNQPSSCVYGRPPPPPPESTFSHPQQLLQQQQQQQQPTPFPSTYPTPLRDANSQRDASEIAAESLEPVNLSQEEWDQICTKVTVMEETLDSLRSLFNSNKSSRAPPPPQQPPSSPTHPESEREQSPQSEGVYGPNAANTDPVHLGPRSVLVDILTKSKDSDEIGQALPKDNLLTDLALGNESAAYPFADLWSSDPYNFNIAGVCGVLPDDQQCLRYLAFYRDIGAVLYPVIPDTFRLELSANQLLRGRARAGGVYQPDPNGPLKPFGVSLSFLGLFFAVLASGCQLSDAPRRERDMTSWVYVSCSYQCLRVVNYVARPTVEVVQVLLIICNVLSYNMNAGASYTLLGMTERLCMILGLHVDSTQFPRSLQDIRRQVWWAMAFQNSHFSLAYDRPSITMISQPEIPFNPKSMPGYRSYFETLCRVVQLALEMLRGRMAPPHPLRKYNEVREYQERMQRILAEGVPHLRHRERCSNLAEHIEHFEIRLHSSYVISVLCRPSLGNSFRGDIERRMTVRAACVESLLSTVEAFVELHAHNPFSSRSWISMQRAIASAFLLVAHEDGQSHPQTWGLIGRLETVLAEQVDDVGTRSGNGNGSWNNKTSTSDHLASSLHAFQEISAAFRAGKMNKPSSQERTTDGGLPKPTATSQSTLMPSPTSTENSMDSTGVVCPAPKTKADENTNAKAQLKRHTWDMQNVLGRVSEVMLFPSLGNES